MLNKKALAASLSAGPATYVEDVFSTYLYTGNGSTQTITNGIDLAGEGGLIWTKNRTNTTLGHFLWDTIRGNNNLNQSRYLQSNSTASQQEDGDFITSWGSTGYTLGNTNRVNDTNGPFVSWTFRKAEKFFDVVTYTGTGSARTVAHNLGSTPACIMVKCTNSAEEWQVYHTSLGNTKYLQLDAINEARTGSTRWNNTSPTSTEFTVGTNSATNGSGLTFVAYLFAHDAGGFGDSGSESVIKCGSYTGNGSIVGPIIDLGWEPQWLLVKSSSASSTNWTIVDNIRGIVTDGTDNRIFPNTSGAEDTTNNAFKLLPNGFQPESTNAALNGNGSTYIYIAIRRGPMKTPEAGTEVFEPTVATVNTASNTIVSSGSVVSVDMTWTKGKNNASAPFLPQTRLTGGNYLQMSATSAESSGTYTTWDRMSGTKPVPWSDGDSCIDYAFRRAPGFMDVVCYTGTGSATTVAHNLGVAPELIIVKMRSATRDWGTGWAPLGWTKRGPALNSDETAFTVSTWWNDTAPTSSVFTVGTSATTNQSGSTYVAYLFASVPSVSKVGSYTGTGTTQQINCGFTAGARFVLIKRTDSTGDWYVWDSARGIVAGNDPYLLLNSTAAEVTNTDYIDTYSSGFEISSTAPAAINANGGTFIFFAVS